MKKNNEVNELKKEIERLRKELIENGIDPDNIEKIPNISEILNGKELRIAAEKGLKVRYICTHYDYTDKHLNFNEDCIMERCNNNRKNETWYYIGNEDICLEDYRENDIVCGETDCSTFKVCRSKNVKYS